MTFLAKITDKKNKVIATSFGDTAEAASYGGFAIAPEGVTSFVTGHTETGRMELSYDAGEIK